MNVDSITLSCLMFMTETLRSQEEKGVRMQRINLKSERLKFKSLFKYK
jgi:hypothetical protein